MEYDFRHYRVNMTNLYCERINESIKLLLLQKNNRMKTDCPAKWKYLVHVLLCSLFLFLFIKNALLRPSPPSAQNKEFCIGTMLLIICYLNAYLLHPVFYQRNKVMTYMICSVVSIIVALVVEYAWLYPDIMECFLRNLSPQEARAYYWASIPFVVLRDTGLLSFTFLVCEFNWSRNHNKRTEKLLLDSEDKIMVRDSSDNDILLDYRIIRYCEQEQNYTKIYCKGDNVYFRYGSLRHFMTLFDKDFFVQINRKTMIARNQIKSLSDNQIWIVGEENSFEVSPAFKSLVEPLIIQWSPDTRPKKKKKKQNEKSSLTHNENAQDVYRFISENPIISAVKIAEMSQLSLSSVNRILKQLKEENLIEYVGSKKTGGYKVKS